MWIEFELFSIAVPTGYHLCRREVEIYRPNRDVEILDNPDTFSAEDVFPEFVWGLSTIW